MGNKKTLQDQFRRNSSGFALVSALAVIPVLLTAFAAGITITNALYSVRKESTICRKILLKTQGDLKRPLRQLMQLNATAKSLYKQHIQAKYMLAIAVASGNAAAIAEATYYLNLVRNSRFALGAKQKYIFLEARRIQIESERDLQIQISKPISSRPLLGLAVYPSPPMDIAPEYHLVEPFRENQAIRVSGKYIWPKSINHLLIQVGLKPMPALPYACGASLLTKGRTWVPVLETGKYYSNS